MDFDPSLIVPSTRDLLQVIATRRRSLSVVALIDGDDPAAEARRLAELDVSAFAVFDAGPAAAAIATATKTVPTLSLHAVSDRAEALRARFFGCDGACIDVEPGARWDEVAPLVRMTRMLPVARAASLEAASSPAALGARAVLIDGELAMVTEAASRLPKNVAVIAVPTAVDVAALRALVGVVDAVVVPPSIHQTKGFFDLVHELDP